MAHRGRPGRPFAGNPRVVPSPGDPAVAGGAL